MYKGRTLFVAIAMSCLPIASAIAQQTSDLVGEWNGKLENWTSGTDLRKLIVAPDGSCRWGYPDTPGGPGAAKSCSVNQATGTIELVTSADSFVKLKLKAGNLEGSLQLRDNGLTFPATLAHGPQPKSAGPQPKSAPHVELLRQAIDARRSDDQTLDLYTSTMKAIVEANRADSQNFFTRFGPIKSIDFTGLEGRTEIYKVEFAHAVVRIRMRIDNDGKIAGFEYRKY
jgi:hypothetical protein